MEIPDEVYYGIQTTRAIKNFAVSGHTTDELPTFIRSIAEVKKAAALANCAIGAMDKKYADAICQAADEIAAGKQQGSFPIDIIQGGGSTPTNMNVNEVIANRANEILTGKKGSSPVHPNTHVNRGQSTNDVIPTAMGLACYRYAQKLQKSLKYFEAVLAQKETEFKEVVKVSRTCVQDAVPITLGQEFSGYRRFIERHLNMVEELLKAPLVLPLGATATGTGLGTFPGYMEEVFKQLKAVTGINVVQNENLFDGLQNSDGYVRISGLLKSLAVGLGKLARDLRIMSSGPRTGFGEITLPAVQPGSSIMPGKINPVIPEMVNQVVYQVCGNDVVVTMAVEEGELDLNVWEPIIIKNLAESFTLLTNVLPLFADLCIKDLQANVETCKKHAEDTLANATVVSAIMGYPKGTKIAQKAAASGQSVKAVVLEEGLMSEDDAKTLLDPMTITDWHKSQPIIGHPQES